MQQKKEKIKREIAVSLLLHAIFFTLLIWSSLDEHIELMQEPKISELTTNFSMVDNSRLPLQSNQQYKTNKQYIKEKLSNQFQHQSNKIDQKNNQKQECIKQIERKQFQVQEVQNEKKEQWKKVKSNVTIKAEQNVKEKTEAKSKKLVKSEKNFKKIKEENIDELFSKLSSDKRAPKMSNKENKINIFHSWNNVAIQDNKNLSEDIKNYTEQIKKAIENHFYGASSYSGKICTLRINLSQNGELLDAQFEEGDISLCNAALFAAKKAKIPKPPSQEVYKIFKNILLDFKP